MVRSPPHRLCVLVALALVACPAAPETVRGPKVVRLPDQTLAHCALAQAPVRIDRGSAGKYDDILVGEQLRSGDKVRTGPLGFARVDLGSGGGVRLSDAAEIELRSLGTTGRSRATPTVAVVFGMVQGFLDPPTMADRERPHMYLRALSAPILIEQQGDKPFLFRARRTKDGLELAGLHGEGSLVLNGRQQELKPGLYLEVIAGEVRDPKELPAPPELSEPGADDRFFCPGLVVRLGWQPSAQATATLVQVARDPSFDALVLSAEVAGDHTLFVPREPGRYLWRAATRGAEGHVGEFGPARPIFCEAAPPADLLYAPRDNAVVRFFGVSPKLTFTWTAWPGATSYRFAIVKGTDLHAPDALVRQVRELSVNVDALEEGEYHWGVWAEEAGDQPLFLEARKLVLVRSRVQTPTSLQQWGP